MSLSFQPSEYHSVGLNINNDALHYDSPPKGTTQTLTAAGTAETQDTSPRLRFNSLTLDELSEELERRTTETQRLQEEVEKTTRGVLERFGLTSGINSSPGQSCQTCRFNASHQQAVTHPLVCCLDSINQELVQGKEALDSSMVGCLQQLSDLRLIKTHNQAEQETSSPQTAIVNLQTQLHNVQMEKDALSDLRLKDSRKHVDQMEKMLCILEELQNIKRSADQKLQETEDEAVALNRKVETLEQSIKEVDCRLYEKQCGHNSVISSKRANSPTQQSVAAILDEDFNNETEKLQERHPLSKEQLSSEESSRASNHESMGNLIANLGQEMAMLTDKLRSSKDSGVILSVKLELLKKLAERQASSHQRHISEIESALSSHKDKQLTEARIQLINAQREKDRSLQQAKELQSQLGQLQRCCEQQQCELQEEVKVQRGQLEVGREQLHRAVEEKTCLQALLEQRAQEGIESQELLREKDEELRFRQQETQQHLARLEEAQTQCQTLQAERGALILKLNNKDKMIDVLRLQMESSIQMTAQHRLTIDSHHQENNLLSNQLNQHKLEIQQLRAELDKHKSHLAAAELERRQLQASVTEQKERVQEGSLEKQQLTTQLDLQRMQLLTLTKEHKKLQQLHICKKEEHEGVVLKLQSQLRDAHDELDRIRSTLRALEGADGHGLQVALDMQKEITARREQVDSMQSRIQHLEENVDQLHQENHYRNLEAQRQLQELTFIRKEKKHLTNELEALRSKDQQLRDRISELEAILHKTSERFANCQDFVQRQEQEFFRLKLQHALDLKELQGQTLRTALNVPPPVLDSTTPSALSAPASSQHASNSQIKSNRQQECLARGIASLVKEPQGVISEKHRPHTDNSAAGSSFHRRRSAPERERGTTFITDEAEEAKAESRLRRKTCGSELPFLRTPEPNGKTINKFFSERHVVTRPVTAGRYISSSQLLSLGRRSPVHALLTSDPAS